ncbi:Cof-type HAD-IIB family hydrolase [Streptococcus gordonii]|uniref:Cof-type HAD-IIB family hydrolase n=1 Tax=Streptococcus gordonii TaxID=1302 RepID=UPI00077916DA|nr:Cof-type HAD-IIB family hydrolase [Streptococcus gordonii]VTT23900.1 haloacid dehalogenase-like hydrolase [Streptococcus gordonii]
MSIRMIATDMDGTLLDGQGQLDLPRLTTILDELDKRDIRYVVATGNEIGRMRKLFGPELTNRITFVVANGARIFEGEDKIVEKHWDSHLVQDVLEYFAGRERNYHLVANLQNGPHTLEGMDFPIVDRIMTEERAREFYRQIHFLSNFQELDKEAVIKMSIVVDEEQTSSVTHRINQDFAGRLNAVTSGYGAIDLLPRGIHKGWGLHSLMESWEIDADQIMAFGDSENDLEMLELAGYSFAMENGEEKVKRMAKYIAPSNDEAGVLQVLEQYLKER